MKFSPLNVPLHRRMETVGALCWFLFTPPFAFVFFCGAFFLACLIPVVGLPLAIGYSIWACFVDDTPSKGGRPIEFFKNLGIWHHFAAFFPAKLVKTADLDPQGNYLFCYHPHGILSVGAFLAFGTNALGFSELFPGIGMRIMTLKMNFTMPFYREYLMAYGAAEVSYKSCIRNLTAGPGRSITIVIGGASEALEAHPNTMRLTLEKRKGFVRVAMDSGASLVPVLCFGENDLYDSVDNPEGSRIRTFQNRMLKMMGYSSPVFHGRGIFNYQFGMLPHRRPLTVVVGAPISVTRNTNPTREEVQEVHAQYTEALKQLYENHKSECFPNRTEDLRIVL